MVCSAVCCRGSTSAPTAMASQRPQPRRCNVDSGGSSNDGVLPHQDVLYEILLRVPARSLCRFRAVCKPWLFLLTDPPFVAAHTARHRGNPLFTVAVEVDGGTKGNVAEIKLLDTSGHGVKMVSTGLASPLIQMRPHIDLVLLRGLSCDHHRLFLESIALRLLDPATGIVSSLPTPNRNGSNNPSSFVLGRTMSSTGGHGEYKVLSLNSSPYATTEPCKVLTVGGGGTWRAEMAPPVNMKAFGNGTVVAKGVVYHLVDNADALLIAAFDLEAEIWQPSLVQGPQLVPSTDGHAQSWRSLAVLNGCLAAVSTYALIMDIWLLMGSGKWFKQSRVRTSSIHEHVWSSAMHVDPLWVLDDGRIALWACDGNKRTGALWKYDPRTGTCTKVAVTENCLYVGVGVYAGNLLL
ncbi:unnamed protein product [Urochloa humidicola]